MFNTAGSLNCILMSNTSASISNHSPVLFEAGIFCLISDDDKGLDHLLLLIEGPKTGSRCRAASSLNGYRHLQDLAHAMTLNINTYILGVLTIYLERVKLNIQYSMTNNTGVDQQDAVECQHNKVRAMIYTAVP